MRQRKGACHDTGNFTLIEGPDGIMRRIDSPFKQEDRKTQKFKKKLSKTRYWIMFFMRKLAEKKKSQSNFINIGKISTFKEEIMSSVLTKVEQKSKNWFHAQVYWLKNQGLIFQEENGTYSVDMETPLVIGRTRKPKTKKVAKQEEEFIPRSKILKQIAEKQELLDTLIRKIRAANNLIATIRQLPSDTYLYNEFMKLVKQVEKNNKKEEEIVKAEKSSIQCLKDLLD